MATTIPMPQPAATARQNGLTLPCPRCGERSASILFEFSSERLTCQDCNEEFDAGAILELIQAWQPVLEWLAQFPRAKE